MRQAGKPKCHFFASEHGVARLMSIYHLTFCA